MDDLREHLLKHYPTETVDSLLNALTKKNPKGLFLNTKKISKEEFGTMFPDLQPHPFVPDAFLFDPGVHPFGRLILQDLGLYYIQDPSSMLPAWLLAPQRGELVLDLCAAPGGKTLLASKIMEDEGLIIANDLNRARCSALIQNIERLGRKNIAVTCLDYESLQDELRDTFPKIILDAPCSGSGMIASSEAMRKDWSLAKVRRLQKRQIRLIRLAYRLLRPGGLLAYSTCSFSYEEDEAVVLSLLKDSDAELVPLKLNGPFFRHPDLPETIHLFPHLFPGEGHFIALIRKPGSLQERQGSRHEAKRLENGPNGQKKLMVYEISTLLPKCLMRKALRPGLLLGEEGKDHQRIMSHQRARSLSAENSLPLDDEKMIKYLSGEELRLPFPDGLRIVSYKGFNVGLVRLKDGRARNLYPKSQRRSVRKFLP